jgi:hypothetical protein
MPTCSKAEHHVPDVHPASTPREAPEEESVAGSKGECPRIVIVLELELVLGCWKRANPQRPSKIEDEHEDEDEDEHEDDEDDGCYAYPASLTCFVLSSVCFFSDVRNPIQQFQISVLRRFS